jgi:hypothetical protein
MKGSFGCTIWILGTGAFNEGVRRGHCAVTTRLFLCIGGDGTFSYSCAKFYRLLPASTRVLGAFERPIIHIDVLRRGEEMLCNLPRGLLDGVSHYNNSYHRREEVL